MSRIEQTFDKLRSRGEKALVGFITAGDPDFDTSLEITRKMCCSGVDLLELGVPFSDPTADGPVIQRSSARAIGAGMNMENVMEMVRRIRGFSTVPIVLSATIIPSWLTAPKSFTATPSLRAPTGLWWWIFRPKNPTN